LGEVKTEPGTRLGVGKMGVRTCSRSSAAERSFEEDGNRRRISSAENVELPLCNKIKDAKARGADVMR
jgi:hypothetical protein